ncbi:MAG TPA: ABC transporter substrate-binding protein [Thermomicrobiales bacterium]|nr:ABC transporter substrate-binding protein [Thermomicrobiales bacterium]
MNEEPTHVLDEIIDSYRSGGMSRRELLAKATIAAAGIALTSRLTANSTLAQGTPKSGGTFTYALNQTGDTLDPAVTTYAVTNKININVFDPLIWQASDLSFVPGLAESWEVAPDSTSFTFKLRKDVKFHDGTPLNADAVKFSWDRIMDPATQSKTAIGQMGPFKQAVVVDDYTIRAEFSEPFAPFLDAVSQSYCSPVSPTAVKKAGTDFTHSLVGTGPYKLKEYVENDHVTLERYDDYNWAPTIFKHQGPGYLDQIVFKMITDDSVRTGTLQSGETDGIDSVPAKDVASFKADPDTYTLLNASAPGIPNLFTLNTEKAPTNDIAVREALNYGTDKQTICTTLFFGQNTPAYGPMSAVTLGYDASIESMYPFDKDKAKSVLDAAGWVVADKGIRAKDGVALKISLYTDTSDQTPPLLQAMWKEIGIDTEINQMDYNALIPIVTKGDANLGNIGWIQGDPDVVRIILYSKNIESGYGWTRFKSAELDSLIVAAASTVDQAKRKDLYAQIQQLTMKNALVLPIDNLSAIYALKSDVKDFSVDSRGWYPWLYNVWLDR